jgi:polyhydroxybutyrate depolymerase
MLATAEGAIVRVARFVACSALVGRMAFAVGGLIAALFGLPATASAASGRIALESGGVARTAYLIQHHRLKKARRPVVIVLRGWDRSGRFRRGAGLQDMAKSSGPVLVFPDPLSGKWSDAPGPEANRDAAFIRDLIAKLAADGIADPRKIFIVGISKGGLLAMRIVCDNANLFAGAAAVLSSMPADLAATCKPSRPLPFLMIAGTADPLVPFRGGKASLPDSKAELLSVDATLAAFGKAAGCREGYATTALPDRDPRDGTRAYVDKLNGCKVPVEAVRIQGGGHVIPGQRSRAAGSARGYNGDVDGAKLIWDFFRRLGG